MSRPDPHGSNSFVSFVPFHRPPAAKKGPRDTFLGDTRKVVGGFSPLKAALGAIPAVYEGHEVRQQPLFRSLL